MDSSYLWFRFTQVAMKVVPILVTLILLAPLAVIFWRMVKHQPKSEAETRAELEQFAREHLAKSEAEHLAANQEAQAKLTREFQEMLEQAKKDGQPSLLLSSDGTATELGQRMEELERYIASAATSSPLPGQVMVGTVVTSEERVFLTKGTATWFSLYPRRWVGILGLAAVALIAGLVVWSALVPARPAFSVSGSWDGVDMQIEGDATPQGGKR